MSLTVDPQFIEYSKSKIQTVAVKSIEAVLDLHNQGATVPFMARYRKERTGNLDEVAIRNILQSFETWQEIVKRKAFVLDEIRKQGSLSDDLKKQIEQSFDLHEIEELYRPYKKKKKTKAKLAQDAGIGPLADWIWQLGHGEIQDPTSLEVKAKEFINPAAQYATYEEVLRGAQHIIVERLANNPILRAKVKDDYFTNGRIITSKTKEFKPNSKYTMYAEFKESVKSLQMRKASHRYLALRRGWQEGELKVTVEGTDDVLLQSFETEAVIKTDSQAASFLKEAAKIALTVHVIPSVTNELHSVLKDKADADAIAVFAENVRRVLMASPFGPKVVLGVDPGLRTGCKIALIDRGGRFLTHTVLQTLGEGAKEKAKKLLAETLTQIQIDAVAVGNGTAGRETEKFIRDILVEIKKEVPVIMVNESGASVYSASDVAREEFPDLDLTVRGAISIARRLQDPLSELVKVDPKSIGVGQYQHDVNPADLKNSLHAVVESCVNQVGVDVNTASHSLLQYVAGIGPAIAKNIVQHRNEKGLFQERGDLMKVAHFSSKVFEQAAGFLRIANGKVVLDQTGIHPERYMAVRDMLSEAGLTSSQAIGGNLEPLKKLREKYVKLIGEFTFDDILTELAKPGRDPRDPFKVFQFREDIHEIKDLKEGMICPGLVTNVTNFGAFVDIGVHQDGLVHISQLTYDFVDDPRTVVNPGEAVTVKVLGVDTEKNQISLTMKLEERPAAQRLPPSEKRSQGQVARERNEQRNRPNDRHRPGKNQKMPRDEGGRERGGRERNARQPFNNPFAALQGFKK